MTGRADAVRPSQARKEGRSPAGLADRPRGPGIRLQGPGGSQGSGTAVQCAEGGAGCRPPGLHRPAGVRPLPPAPRFIARAPRGPFQTRAASSDFLRVAATLGKRASWCPLHFALSLSLSLSLWSFQMFQDWECTAAVLGVRRGGEGSPRSQAALSSPSCTSGRALREHHPLPAPLRCRTISF